MRKVLLAYSFVPAFSLFGQQLNYYFGNLHAHTAFSDGNKDSIASGVHDPSGSYAYAKLSNDFDFLGISEHNHYSSAHNPGFIRPQYQAGLQQADAANDDLNFLALFGMEYGVSSEYNGHVLIYGCNQLLGWENSVPGINGNNYDVFNGKTDYDGLFKKVKAVPGAFCYLAHPSFSDFSTLGTWETALANASYVPDYDSVIVGMPLRSGVATSTASTYSDYSTGNYFNYYKKLLYQGYHIGIGYDHDNHYTNFGRSNGGRLVIMAPSLTRVNLFTAMKRRNFYGSDDPNAKVNFTVNGKIMGSIVKDQEYPTISVTHNDPDGEVADSIKIWKGWANSGGLWAYHVHTTLNSNTSGFTDDYNVNAGTEYYYFAEIRQKDGQWIVTSPVWYTATSITGIDSGIASAPVVALNAVMKSVYVSFPVSGNRVIDVTDMTGRVLLTASTDRRDVSIDTSLLSAGIYVLVVRAGNANTLVKKIVIE